MIAVIECVEWLTGSEWPGLTVADGLVLFGVGHAAAESASERFVDMVLAIPLSLALFFVGLSAALTAISLGDWGSNGNGRNGRDLKSLFLSDD